MIPVLDPTEAAETSYQKGKAFFDDSIRSGKILNCSPGYVGGYCPGGHKFAAVQFCGREYCQDCSRDGSPIHQRRVKKGWETVKEWAGVGYYVLTIPENLRYLFYDQHILRDFRFKVLRKLKEDYGYTKGLARWHWFGDCQVCGGSGCIGCGNTGAGNYWHPHLNILVPSSGYIENLENHLRPLRQFMAGYFRKLINKEIELYEFLIKQTGSEELMILLDDLHERKKSINSDLLVLNYSYANEPSKMMNRVKYVTRSTFKRYDDSVKTLLYNFRNSVKWGWKKDEDNQETQEPIYCPQCEENGVKHLIKWGSLKKFKDNDKIKKHEQPGQQQRRKNTGLYYLRNGNNERDQGNSGFTPVHIKRSKNNFREWATISI